MIGFFRKSVLAIHPEPGVRPAEWEPHDAVWLSWSHNKATFPKLSAVEEAFFEFVTAIHPSERIELFIPTAAVHGKSKPGSGKARSIFHLLNFIPTEFSDVWIRDYGPTFVINRALKRSAIVR